MAETLANNAAGTLNAAITNAQTSFALNAGQGAAFPSSGNFRIIIDSELMLVGARATDTLSSITRGVEGTAAVSHLINAPVTHILTTTGLTNFVQEHSVQSPASIAVNETAVYNGTSWVRSSVTPLSEGSIKPGLNGQFIQTAGGVTVWGASPAIAQTHLPGVIAFSTGKITLTANTAYLIPIPNVTVPVSISRIVFAVGAATSGNMDLGIYYSDDEITFTRLYSFGTFAVPAINTINYKAITQQTITPLAGRRWYYALAADNATAQFEGTNPGGGAVLKLGGWGVWSKATSFVLPATISTPVTGDAANAPVVHGLI